MDTIEFALHASKLPLGKILQFSDTDFPLAKSAEPVHRQESARNRRAYRNGDIAILCQPERDIIGRMNFSDLATDFTGETHPLYELLERVRTDGHSVADLVKGNVTEAGIQFPQDVLDRILLKAAKRAAVYKPDPLGQKSARSAVAKFYDTNDFKPEQICLTTGTSLSYLYCFKLLAQPGDEILCPTPSYPLLDFIAQMSGVTLRYYNLSEEMNWQIDLADLEQNISSKTKAIVLISPHNPTGMVCSEEALQSIAELAQRHKLPIISDEVFSKFVFSHEKLPRIADTKAPLVFTLNGISKSFALPGWKLGWIIVSGERQLVKKSIDVLEMISDTFLPVNETVQLAAEEIFELGKDFQKEYVVRIAELRSAALNALEGVDLVPPHGGFYITMRIDKDEDDASIHLLKEKHILVHPGHFYEIEGNHLVTTFIHKKEELVKYMNAIGSLVRIE